MLMGQFIKKRAGLIQNVAITSTCTLRCSAVMAEVPPLTPDEVKAELAKLTTLAGVELRPEVFDVLVELTRLDVVPTATAQVLKSLCVKSAMRASVGGGSGGPSCDSVVAQSWLCCGCDVDMVWPRSCYVVVMAWC